MKLWRAATGECCRYLPALDFEARAPAYSPNGNYIAVRYTEGTIRLWNARTGALERLFQEAPEHVPSLAFSSDGSQLSTGFGSTATVWDVATGRLLQSPAPPEPESVAGGYRREIRSPDGHLSASSVGRAGTVELRRSDTGELLHLLPGLDNYGIVFALAFSPDGKILAVGYGGFRARLWDVETGKLLQLLRTHEDGVCALAFSPDGTLLAVGGSYGGAVVLCDLDAERRPIRLVMTPDGRNNALTRGHLWRPRIEPEDLSGEEVTLQTHSNVRGAAFSPDGRHVATVGQDAALKLWEPATGRLVATLTPLPQVEQPSPAWIAYTPEGYYHASPGAGDSIRRKIGEDLHEADALNRPEEVAGRLR